MNRNAIFSRAVPLLLAVLCLGFRSFAENPAPSAARDGSNALSSTPDTSAKDQSPLHDKTLVVRLYGDGSAPSVFQRIEMVIHHEDGCAGGVEATAKGPMPYFLLDKREIPEDSVLLIMPEDQADPTVREHLGNCVLTPLMQKGRCYFCLNRHGRKVQVTDALGAPIADAMLEFRFNAAVRKKTVALRYGSWRTDAAGYAELPEMGPYLVVAEAFVAQPAYGTACVRNPDYRRRIDTPLVAEGTEARERALRGRVVDAEDRPVEGAIVSVESVAPPAGIETRLSPPAIVLTDAKGCFALLTGNSRLPARSLYRYKVAPPAGAPCVNCDGEATNDAETVIRLERGAFHTFIFKDESGQIINDKIFGCISRKGTRFGLDSDEVRSGAVLANGTYSAIMQHVTEEKVSTAPGSESQHSTSEPVTFPEIEVTDSSPKELVFSLAGVHGLVFRGEVLHAKTQAPLDGVLVTTGGLPAKALRPEEQQWLSPLVSDANSGSVQDSTFTRTDKDGHFELTLTPGQKCDRLALWARDFLPYKHRPQETKPDDDGAPNLEKIPMFPAGMLSFQVNSEEAREEYIATWKFEEPTPSLCAFTLWDSLLGGLAGLAPHLLQDNLHRVNRPVHLYIPAGAAVSLEIRSLRRFSRCLVLPRRFDLAQGETLNLEPFTFPPAIDVSVQVVDEHGNPYERVPVHPRVGKFGDPPIYTDDKGKATISLPPDSSGTLSLAKKTRDGIGPDIVICPFSLHGNVPDKSPYVLVLPKQDAPQVFGNTAQTDSEKSPDGLATPIKDAPRVLGSKTNISFPQQPKLRLRHLYQLSLPAGNLDDGACRIVAPLPDTADDGLNPDVGPSRHMLNSGASVNLV